ncbi:Spermatogenesis-associated protein 17 [Collichthys lucidus]|uniref:Spermatogenesis-associated protein 17 n=1 Tax=Collichthys lucidus TaxID=240159 RepID=A0A4U5U831_COLLU|nr:Spermatogenesis-associated protein 17 [Collichthys lucidus]
MAELLQIKSQVKEFQQEYVDKNSHAEENRQKENQAATRIQSWFRACKVRAYLSHLHKQAVIIQKIWRGFTARARFRQMVKAAYFIMKMNFYEEMAVRIQRRWRGFFVRKYIHNFYTRKSYLEGVSQKNELVRQELDELEELQKRERDCLEMVKEQTAKVYQAYRLHHLLSTKQCPGVFNSPFRPAPHEMEQLLRQVKYQAPTRGRGCLLVVMDKVEVLAVEVVRPGHRSPFLLFIHQICRIQFREPGEVWEQHVHCPDLTLRLQTSHTHLEEAQKQLRQQQYEYMLRLFEDCFRPRLIYSVVGTGSMLHHLSHSRSPFTHPAYAKSFRYTQTQLPGNEE